MSTIEPSGTLETRDTVFAFVGNKKKRLAVAVLTEGKTDYGRKKRINALREEIQQKRLETGTSEWDKYSKAFNWAAAEDIAVHIKSADHAPVMIDFVLEETDQDIIVFDCHDKQSFWQCLTRLEIPRDRLFAIAEMEQFRLPQKVVSDHRFEGEAHNLAKAIRAGKVDIFDNNQDELARMLTHSAKVRLPLLDIIKQKKLTHQHYLKESIKARKSFIQRTSESIKNNTARYANLPLLTHAWLKALPFLKTKFDRGLTAMKQNVADIEETIQPFEDALKETPESELQDCYDDRYINRNGKNGNWSINVHDGIHRLPHEPIVFEFDVEFDDEPHVKIHTNLIVLMRSHSNNSVKVSVFGGNKKTPYMMADSDFYFHLKNNSVDNFEYMDARTKQPRAIDVEMDGKDMSNGVFFDLSMISHIVNAVAQINEPNFPEIVFADRRRRKKKKDTTLQKFGENYFRYFHLEDFTKPNRIRTIYSSDANKGSHSSPVLHKVRGHPRRIQKEDKTHITFVVPHLRGDASKGVSAKSLEL
jgi:hypothetical protein